MAKLKTTHFAPTEGKTTFCGRPRDSVLLALAATLEELISAKKPCKMCKERYENRVRIAARAKSGQRIKSKEVA